MADAESVSDERHILNGFRSVPAVGPVRSTPPGMDRRGQWVRRPRSASASRTNLRLTDEKIVLNVSGVRFVTFPATLHRMPATLLYDLAENGRYFDEQRQEFFFDRSATIFESILNYYRTGELHFGQNVCPRQMKKELEFWRIPDTEMDDCCWLRYTESESLDVRRRKLRHLIDDAKLKQKEKLDELRAMPPADSAQVTKQIFDVLDRSNIYPDVRLMLISLKECSKELFTFVLVLLLCTFYFAIFIRVFEDTDVIPGFGAAIWWSFVTMTTVGYGSVPLRSRLGCITGMFCILTGIILITLPLPVVARKLLELRLRLWENERLRKRDIRRDRPITLPNQHPIRGRDSHRKKTK